MFQFNLYHLWRTANISAGTTLPFPSNSSLNSTWKASKAQARSQAEDHRST